MLTVSTRTPSLISRLNAIVRGETAFLGLGDMLSSMESGYVPTLRPTTTGLRLLRAMLLSWGYRVWAEPVRGWDSI